ncbi:MAG: DUF4476 domain-containing protein [Candidatus Cloacimonetes bacterium]|nr:DUF4476 domain-containing protein [Candidatus Cloacimonadota bacterium]
MKKYFILFLIVTVSMIWAQNTSAQFGFSSSVQVSDTSNSKLTNDERIEQIMENLNVLQYSYLKKLDKSDYKDAVKLVEEIKALLGKESVQEEVTTQVSTQNETAQSVNINMNFGDFGVPKEEEPVVTQQAAPPVKQVVVNEPMDNGSFNNLISQIRSESFSEDQMRYIRTASKNYYFSVNQVGQLIDEFTFSEDKIDCLRITYPKVIDKENGFNLIGRYTFEDEKEQAEQIINQ